MPSTALAETARLDGLGRVHWVGFREKNRESSGFFGRKMEVFLFSLQPRMGHKFMRVFYIKCV